MTPKKMDVREYFLLQYSGKYIRYMHVYNDSVPYVAGYQYYTITALERDQYEVSWSRVQQY